MLDLFGRLLSGFMTVMAIIILILGFVLGGVIVDNTTYRATSGEIFFGRVIGFVVALIFDVMTYGVIGIFIEMRDTQQAIKIELREIKEMMQKAEKRDDKASSAATNVASAAPKRVLNPEATSTYKLVRCPKCGADNAGYNYICNKCGNSLR